MYTPIVFNSQHSDTAAHLEACIVPPAHCIPRSTHSSLIARSYDDKQVPPPVKSRKRARKIVTSFHKITKEAGEVESSAATDGEKANHLERLQRELEEMGGRQAYQSASLLSVSFHNTSKWVTQLLTSMNLRPQRGQPPLKVLEVRRCILPVKHSVVPCQYYRRSGYSKRERHCSLSNAKVVARNRQSSLKASRRDVLRRLTVAAIVAVG